MLHYLPGCDVKKNHAEAILKIEKYMKEREVKIERCCRTKDTFLQKGDTIIHNCTLCELIVKETHPNNTCLSIYEYILEDIHFPWIDQQGKEITIQDCWRTRDNLALQKAIRKCLIKMNYTIVEMDENYNKTKYCGVWLNNYPTKDCLYVAPITFQNIIENHTNLVSGEEQKQYMEEWVSQYTTEEVLVYCNGCEKGIKIGGGQPIHMIELLAKGLR